MNNNGSNDEDDNDILIVDNKGQIPSSIAEEKISFFQRVSSPEIQFPRVLLIYRWIYV